MYIRLLLAIALSALVFGWAGLCQAARSNAMAKLEMIRVYDGLRKALHSGDIEGFKKLVKPPDPSQELTPKMFAEIKQMMSHVFPETGKIIHLKYGADDKKGMLVVQTVPQKSDLFYVTALHFVKDNQQWKLSGNINTQMFNRENPAKDRRAVLKELKENPKFQFAQKAPAKPKAAPTQAASPKLGGKSASGYLAVSKFKVNFKHAVAYKRKLFNESYTIVLLTETPLDRGKLMKKLKQSGDWLDFVTHLKLGFNAKNKLDQVWFWVKKHGMNVSAGGAKIDHQVKVSAKRIKGTANTPKPQKVFKTEYQFKVAFDAEIIFK
jgi:hypothetical protein